MAEIPHFDFPFRLQGSKFAEVEQDSLDEIVGCVEVALLTPVGMRKELPDFGTTDTTFENQPIDTKEITDQILLHEPRATVVMSQQPDYLNTMIVSVKARVSGREEESS